MAARSWLEPLLSAEEMRAIDAWAIDRCGIPSLTLMENAGRGVAAAVAELDPAGPVRIVCGKGNNGGDGLVAARLLRELRFEAEALTLWSPVELSEDARANHERLLAVGGRATEVNADELPSALAGSALVIDALLGTGFSGSPRAPLDAAIASITACECPVLAVDVPSGVDASTGEVEGDCVHADVTVTFHAPKVGLWVLPGKAHAGRVEVIDIGVPERPDTPPAHTAGLIGSGVLDLVPRRVIDSTKFSSGSVLAVGGSTGLTGAACMACEAAMRAGAGWVRAAVPRSLNAIFEQKLTEVMTVPLPDSDGHLLTSGADEVLEAAQRADAVVLGPGIGRTDEALELARRLAVTLEQPLLLDADGLNALAGRLERLKERSGAAVLTPHAAELARLLATESADVSAHRLARVRAAAASSGATVVLKGDDSLVAGGESVPVAVSPSGSPALATAGTGDVLSGTIGAFLAKGLAPFDAACAGVYVHSQAGWIAAAEHGADCVIATDVIEALPAALSRPADQPA